MLLTTQPWSALSPVVVLEPLTPSRISYLTLYLGYTVVDPLDDPRWKGVASEAGGRVRMVQFHVARPLNCRPLVFPAIAPVAGRHEVPPDVPSRPACQWRFVLKGLRLPLVAIHAPPPVCHQNHDPHPEGLIPPILAQHFLSGPRHLHPSAAQLGGIVRRATDRQPGYRRSSDARIGRSATAATPSAKRPPDSQHGLDPVGSARHPGPKPRGWQPAR